MSIRRAIVFLFALIFLAPPACQDDCERLAETVCAHVGPASDDCKKIRAKADEANADDRRDCGNVIGVVEDFTKR